MVMNKNITRLLGYKDNQVHSIERRDDTTLDEVDGIKINIQLGSLDDTMIYHFISDNRLSELVTEHRNISLSVLDSDLNEPTSFPKWKVGDMCYLDMEVHYISNMDDHRITQCITGRGGAFGHDLTYKCFEITPFNMMYTQHTLDYINKIDNKYLNNEVSINNTIYTTFNDMWSELINEQDPSLLEQISNLSDLIINAIDNEKYDTTYINSDGNENNIFIKK